jgi:ubiquinone/menaquinone biosynthesis C-methylase UbiE
VAETALGKRDIGERFATRADAERYRDRFTHGKRRRTHLREVAALERLLAACGDWRVAVDVGSGAGRFAPVLGRGGAMLIQLDLAPSMLEVSRNAPAVPGRSDYVRGDARRLPLPARSADLVFSHRLLNHLDEADRRQAVAELVRVTRRFVIVSSLAPPPPIRYVREAYDHWRGATHKPARHLDSAMLTADLSANGARPIDRAVIRRFPAFAEFLLFEKG